MPRLTRNDLAPVFKAPKTLIAADAIMNGAVIADALETGGTQTPTLGANKPGSVGGDPVAWMVFTHEGVEYMAPCWRRDA